MSKTIEQKLYDQIVVLKTEDLRDILYGSDEYEDAPGHYTYHDVGGIIHLGFHDVDAPGAVPIPRFEIPQRLRALPDHGYYKDITHHFSELFYGGIQIGEFASSEALAQMQAGDGSANAMQLGGLLDIKRQNLQDTLAFARDVLSANEHRKLFIHGPCGSVWSPLLGLGIIADHLGAGKEKEAIEIMVACCLSGGPNLLEGQLAFLDHALGRGGKLIDAWASERFKGKSYVDKARRYYQSFEIAAHEYHGPRRDLPKLRQGLRACNPDPA